MERKDGMSAWLTSTTSGMSSTGQLTSTRLSSSIMWRTAEFIDDQVDEDDDGVVLDDEDDGVAVIETACIGSVNLDDNDRVCSPFLADAGVEPIEICHQTTHIEFTYPINFQ
jgi:hypothetical protein